VTQLEHNPHSMPDRSARPEGTAQEGEPLNLMCASFNQAANQSAFRENEEGYLEQYGLTADQRAAVRSRDALRLVRLGGNIYLLAKFAEVLCINVQELELAAAGQDAVDVWHDLVLLLDGKAGPRYSA
jgi:protocatechuate 4,5-dioxygenase alpha chain